MAEGDAGALVVRGSSPALDGEECGSALWSVAWVRTTAEFAALGPDWDELHSRCPSATPFSTHAWLYSWWTGYGHRRELAIACVRRGSRLVAVAPLMRRNRFGPAVLTMIGAGVSDYADFLIDDRCAAAASARLAELVGSRWRVVDVVEARPGSAAENWTGHWPGPVWNVAASSCLRLAAAPTGQVLAALPARTRHRIQGKLRKTRSLALVERAVPVDELPAAVANLLDLHRRGWAGRGMNPEHATARFRSFLCAAVVRLAEDGMAQVREHHLGAELVTSELLVDSPGFLGSYLYGVAPELRARADTSTLLISRDLNLAARTGRPTLDLLRGSEAHKLRWRPVEVANRRLILGRGPLVNAYAAAVRARRRLQSRFEAGFPTLAEALRASRHQGPRAIVSRWAASPRRG